MQRIGLRATWLLAGALATLVPALWMWGFTVDDALISVRYARHLAGGVGWRFNAEGPTTDGVTPLPWPVVLSPLAHAGALDVLARAKALGLAAWGTAGVLVGAAAGADRKAPAWAKAVVLFTLAISVPVAAHAVSGMETALTTALATGAAVLSGRPRLAAALAGLAASLRPEMTPWALTLAAGFAIVHAKDARLSFPFSRCVRNAVTSTAIALAPFALCVFVRLVAWGRPAPLAVFAKPSDLVHGLAYVGAGCVVTLVPVLAFAPWTLRRLPVALVLVLAFLAHAAAVAFAGGDWMPYARLMVPVVPSLALVAVLLSAKARPMATAVRGVVAVTTGVILLARYGTEGRRVGADRSELVALARPFLSHLARVAAVDIGWVSAATDADIVDLAGVTDPEIAALHGGHTSKRVGGMYLLARRPDALLLYAPRGLPEGRMEDWQNIPFGRVVEARLAADEVVARHFAPVVWLPLGSRGAGYLLLRATE